MKTDWFPTGTSNPLDTPAYRSCPRLFIAHNDETLGVCLAYGDDIVSLQGGRPAHGIRIM
jgi:hypothetical protein